MNVSRSAPKNWGGPGPCGHPCSYARGMCNLQATHVMLGGDMVMYNDISDNEIMISGYQLHYLDRNGHGGGVLMYALAEFNVSAICHSDNNLEFLPLSVKILFVSQFIDPFFIL